MGANAQILPQDFYYIGGNVGGPISLFGFNKNKDKLFFWGGYDSMIQHPYTSPVEMNVPDGSAARRRLLTLTGAGGHAAVPAGVMNTYGPAYSLPCNTDDGWQGCRFSELAVGRLREGAKFRIFQPYFDPQGLAVTKNEPREQPDTGREQRVEQFRIFAELAGRPVGSDR